MVKLVKVYFLSLLLIVLNIRGAESSLGQREDQSYFGPHIPIYKNVSSGMGLVSEDDYSEDWYFQSKFQNEFFYLNDFIQGEFLAGHYCPDQIYNQYANFYQYLVRILSLSYLHSSIGEYRYTALQFGLKDLCHPQWDSFFQECHPQSDDMKTFIKNVKYVLANVEDIVVPYELAKKLELQRWINDFKSKNFKFLTQERLDIYCLEHKCSNVSSESLKKQLTQICAEDLNKIKLLCNEEDQFYGISYAPEVYPLLLRSNALRSITPQRYQAGCLRRFILENQNRELVYRPLRSIFSHLYSKNLQENNPYEQGRLFIVGAIKEFQKKGLKELFKEEKKQDSLPKEVAKGTVIKEKPIMEEIELPSLKKKTKKVVPKEKKIVVKEKIQKNSAFKVASDIRKKEGHPKVSVDMFKFKYDFVFTVEQNKNYADFAKQFSSQDSLKKMLKEDNLGSKDAPVPLKFLKYLIDKKLHQGLFNITFVLGEKFFVINDIDKGNEVDFIELLNDRSTGHQWKISILKPEN